MEVAKLEKNFSIIENGTNAFTLGERIIITQKEVDHVQQTTQFVSDFCLRRLMPIKIEGRSGKDATPAVSLDALNQAQIQPIHRALFVHAFALQTYAFSGGEIADLNLLYPMWLNLMLSGNGLRRMTPDTATYANRLSSIVGAPTPTDLAHYFIKNPWKAYRLGLFSLSYALLDPSDVRVEELRLRLRLATSKLDCFAIEEINRIAPCEGKLRISLVSSAVAYSVRQKQEIPTGLIHELNTWIAQVKEAIPSGEDAPLIAQVINASNLYLLSINSIENVETDMEYLLSTVIPRIESTMRRKHIEGNAYYQQSILARRRGDRTGEVNALLQAMNQDRYFATLYYRMAQVLHDEGRMEAGAFYELALALSPLDFPTANDYGCWLMDSGQTEKFNSWSSVCQLLYPEQFSGTNAEGEQLK